MNRTSIRLSVLVVGLAVALLAAVSCGGQDQGGGSGAEGNVARKDIRIAVVTHGQASDPFWSVVKNGVDQAAKDMGVEVNYSAPETFDMVQMSQLIDAAVASEPDGLAISVPDPAALEESVQKANDAGIPMVTLNSGVDVYEHRRAHARRADGAHSRRGCR